MLGVSAWLKSTFVLWYINTIYQTDDLLELLFQNRNIPMPRSVSFLKKLSVFSRNVIAEEMNVIKVARSLENPPDEEFNVNEVFSKHNEAVRANMRSIDQSVFKHLKFSRSEIREVYRTIQELDFCDYGISTSLKQFIDETLGD